MIASDISVRTRTKMLYALPCSRLVRARALMRSLLLVRDGQLRHRSQRRGAEFASGAAARTGVRRCPRLSRDPNGESRMADSDDDQDRFRKLAARFRVKPGTRVKLPQDHDPRDSAGIVKADSGELLKDGIDRLSEYQARLAAQDRVALLVIIQALDAAGKDGTIQHVMSGVNPQGVEVTSFKVPSPQELDHDFLWRASKALPARGMIGIFNRSYYEEVLV